MTARFHLPVLLAAVLAMVSMAPAAQPPDLVTVVAELIAPAKLATLSQSAVNQRVRKYVYWLHIASTNATHPRPTAEAAALKAGYTNDLARQLTVDAMLRNLDITTDYGCLGTVGLAEMRRGLDPTIPQGPSRGDQLSVDHILPRAAFPQLANVIANLQLMPQRMNASKSAKLSPDQFALAGQLRRAGLLRP